MGQIISSFAVLIIAFLFPTVIVGIALYFTIRMHKILKMTMKTLDNDMVRAIIFNRTKINRANSMAMEIEDALALRDQLYAILVQEHGNSIELRKFFFEEGKTSDSFMPGFKSILERITGKKTYILK